MIRNVFSSTQRLVSKNDFIQLVNIRASSWMMLSSRLSEIQLDSLLKPPSFMAVSYLRVQIEARVVAQLQASSCIYVRGDLRESTISCFNNVDLRHGKVRAKWLFVITTIRHLHSLSFPNDLCQMCLPDIDTAMISSPEDLLSMWTKLHLGPFFVWQLV